MVRVWIAYEPGIYSDLLAQLFKPLEQVEIVADPLAGVDVVIFRLSESGQPEVESLAAPLPEAKLVAVSSKGDLGLVRLPGETQWRKIQPFGLAHLFLEVASGRQWPPGVVEAVGSTASTGEPGLPAMAPQPGLAGQPMAEAPSANIFELIRRDLSGRPARRPMALVVDDDEDVLELVRVVLTGAGLDVTCVTSGSEALDHFAALKPDVVVLDIMLPDVNGWAVYRDIRKTSEVPIVMITALADKANRQRGQDLGAAGYVTKPFLPADLAQRILSVVH